MENKKIEKNLNTYIENIENKSREEVINSLLTKFTKEELSQCIIGTTNYFKILDMWSEYVKTNEIHNNKIKEK